MGTVSGDGIAGSGGDEKIFVSIRLRPLNAKERARNDVSDWECVKDDTIVYRNNLSVSERSMYPTGYTFDRVFSFDCSTRQVYNEGAKDVALSVVGGINASIFAYGQTSSGKTYTMSGITEYTVADIYDYLNKHIEREYIMKFSAMEIYNESVRDLLSTDSTPLRLLDDPERGTIVEKLTDETLRDWNHFRELLSICEDQRQIGETSLNEASSRSHQILRLTIESSPREFKGNDKASALSATVNFIDLAGSERASQTLSAGTRLKEGCHINRSLLTLGTVIRKLSKGRNSHVPYRDSKLTRILQSSLGGNARTAIICTLSPARSHVEQSRNTLLFASCAKEVATNAKVNVVMSDKALVKKLQRELARLESELSCAGTTTSSSDSSDVIREKDLQIEKLKKEVLEVTLQRDAALSQVKDLLREAEEDAHSVMVDLDQYYPKLRVRSGWDYEHQAPRALVLPHSQQNDTHIRSFDIAHNSRNSDVQSSHSDENYQEHDFDENSLPSGSSSPQMSVRIPNFVGIDSHLEERKEYSDDDLDNVCKEVRCIEVEEPSTNRHINTNRSFNSPEAKAAVPVLKSIDDEVSPNEELGSPCFKKNAHPNSFPPVFQISSPDKPYSWLVERDFSGSAYLKLARSRSCRARVSAGIYSCLFDGENAESTPPMSLDTDIRGRSEGFPKKVPALNYGADIETTSGNNPPEVPQGNGSVDKLPNIESQDKLLRSDSQEKLSQHGSVEKLSTNDSHEKLLRHDSVEDLSRSSSQEKLLDSLWEAAVSSGSQEEKLSGEESPEITSKRTFREKKMSREASPEVLFERGSRGEKLSRDGSPEITSKRTFRETKIPGEAPQEVSLERGSHGDKLSRDGSPKITSKRTFRETKVSSEAYSRSEKISVDGSQEMFPDIGSLEGETISRNGSVEMLTRSRSQEKLLRSHSQEKLSRNSSQGSGSSDDIDELKIIDSTSSNHDESTNMISEETEDAKNHLTERSPADSKELINTDEKLPVLTTRSVKDIGLDPIQSDVENPSKWPLEFKRIQAEIIELWHACNVSLVHRTYFLLLFRGDPSDSIYMEVELRRLSFIRNTFSHGNQTIEDGRTLTYESSLRALCRERLMLSRQMRKKLSKPERENIYLKWGIGLNAKHRRLQLAHRLWANTRDMDRIAESAAIVVKLVGLEEPDHASKEMFGLRFTPRRTARRYYGLTQGVKSFLE